MREIDVGGRSAGLVVGETVGVGRRAVGVAETREVEHRVVIDHAHAGTHRAAAGAGRASSPFCSAIGMARSISAANSTAVKPPAWSVVLPKND